MQLSRSTKPTIFIMHPIYLFLHGQIEMVWSNLQIRIIDPKIVKTILNLGRFQHQKIKVVIRTPFGNLMFKTKSKGVRTKIGLNSK